MIKAENLNATVLLGSATPDLITYHRAKVMGSIDMFELPYRISDKSINNFPKPTLVAKTPKSMNKKTY